MNKNKLNELKSIVDDFREYLKGEDTCLEISGLNGLETREAYFIAILDDALFIDYKHAPEVLLVKNIRDFHSCDDCLRLDYSDIFSKTTISIKKSMKTHNSLLEKYNNNEISLFDYIKSNTNLNAIDIISEYPIIGGIENIETYKLEHNNYNIPENRTNSIIIIECSKNLSKRIYLEKFMVEAISEHKVVLSRKFGNASYIIEFYDGR